MTYLLKIDLLFSFFIVGFLYFKNFKNIFLYERIQVFLVGMGILIGLLFLLC